MTSAIFIATRHETFAAVVSRQLELRGHRVETVAVGDVMRTIGPENNQPDVMLIDCDATFADGMGFYNALRTTLAAYQILLICTENQASTAGELALSGKAFDYVLTSSANDPHRIPLVVDRALAAVQKENGDERIPYQQILQSVDDLRKTLRSNDAGVIKELLDEYQYSDEAGWAGADLGGDVTQGDEHRLVDIICGRLRRMENQILLLEKGMPGAARSTGKRILVVDDDDVCTELLEGILDRHGFEVIVASTAASAKSAISERRPDLVLMDVHLDGANGIKLVEVMRTDEAWRDMPVILVTSDRQRSTICYAADVNVEGYVLKPYEPEYLIRKIRAVLKGAPVPRIATPD